MNAPVDPATIEPLLHDAQGQPPLAGMGKFFRDDQGETFQPHRPEHRGMAAIIGVLALEDGRWMARDNGFRIDSPIFATRAQALRCSIARRIKTFRRFGRQSDGIHWEWEIVGRMVEWALSLKPEVTSHGEQQEGATASAKAEEQAPPHCAPAPTEASPVTDPIVAELTNQYRARRFLDRIPSGHDIDLATDKIEIDGDIAFRTARCACGADFKCPASKFDATVELHFQKIESQIGKVETAGATESQNNGSQDPAPSDTRGVATPRSDAPTDPAVLAQSAGAAGSTNDDDDQLWEALKSSAWRAAPNTPAAPALLPARPPERIERLERATLYLGDCREILGELGGGRRSGH